jgi:hypothetical protein
MADSCHATPLNRLIGRQRDSLPKPGLASANYAVIIYAIKCRECLSLSSISKGSADAQNTLNAHLTAKIAIAFLSNGVSVDDKHRPRGPTRLLGVSSSAESRAERGARVGKCIVSLEFEDCNIHSRQSTASSWVTTAELLIAE